MPLVSCPGCSSKLIYPLAAEPYGAAHQIVHRRCPECEHVDRVVASTLASALWERAQQRRAVELSAELLALELSAWLAERDADHAPEAP
jgi:hypothetical protein